MVNLWAFAPSRTSYIFRTSMTQIRLRTIQYYFTGLSGPRQVIVCMLILFYHVVAHVVIPTSVYLERKN